MGCNGGRGVKLGGMEEKVELGGMEERVELGGMGGES